MTETFTDLRELELLSDLQTLETNLSAWQQHLAQLTADLDVATTDWMDAEARLVQVQASDEPILLAAYDDERQRGVIIDTQFRAEHPLASAAADRLQSADEQRRRASGVMTNLQIAKQNLEAQMPGLQQDLDAKRGELQAYRQQRAALQQQAADGAFVSMLRRLRGEA